jgi:hypothetical protein
VHVGRVRSTDCELSLRKFAHHDSRNCAGRNLDVLGACLDERKYKLGSVLRVRSDVRGTEDKLPRSQFGLVMTVDKIPQRTASILK